MYCISSMGATESTPADQHGATAESVGDKVLNVVTAPLAACCRYCTFWTSKWHRGRITVFVCAVGWFEQKQSKPAVYDCQCLAAVHFGCSNNKLCGNCPCICSTRAPARASVLLNSKKGELPVCNAAYKGDLHELQSLAHQGPGRKLNVAEKGKHKQPPSRVEFLHAVSPRIPFAFSMLGIFGRDPSNASS